MGIMLGLAALLDLALLSDNALILYPLAVLSGLAVPIILTVIYTVLWVLVTKQENRYLFPVHDRSSFRFFGLLSLE